MSPGRAEAHAEDARSALTRRLARSYLRPDIAPSHRACAVHSRESTSVPSRLSSAAPPLSAEPTGLNPPTPVSGEPEKSSVQALDRTQPGLPIKKGRCGTMTHDYKRHGTTTLFAALDVATGAVIGESYRRHRHQEVLRFLKKVEKTVPKEQELHIILDNYATHKHEEVLRWIERGKRIFLHFIPTSSSWLNMVERFFRTLTDRQIRRGVFTSVKELEARLAEYIDTYNENPQPFVWTKSAKQILDKVGRARQALGHQST